MKMVAGFLSLVLLVSSSVLALDTVTTEAPANETMAESSGDTEPTSGKSAQINLPGIGEVDLSSFKLPSLPSLFLPKIPTIPMPNMSLPVLPSLPKLFSEVPCLSLSSGRPGVCRKQEACADGVADGPCALGLGVCCTQPLTCGQTIIIKDSVIANPGFPQPTTGRSQETCSVTIIKRLDTVQIRLDLEVFDIAGPDANGVCSQDVMEVTGGNTGALVPRICGLNHGQHLYIPVDKSTLLNPVTVKFTLSKESQYARSFRIRVSQLAKESPLVAPAGCSQFFTEEKGIVHSFNYERVKNVGIRQIAGLEYGICFQKKEGRCGVRLQPAVTRVTRSLAARTENRRRSLSSPPPAYGFFPAHHNVWLRRPVPQRPRYLLLNRPPVVYTRPQPSPFHRMVARPPVHARPVYYPAAPRPIVYYKPIEAKPMKPLKQDTKTIVTEKKNKAKDEIDGMLVRKKELIDELFTLINKHKTSPALPVLPDLKSVLAPKGLPAIPEIKLPVIPTLPPLINFSLPKLPKLDVSEFLTLTDLLKKHEQAFKSITSKAPKKDDDDKSSHAAVVKPPVLGLHTDKKEKPLVPAPKVTYAPHPHYAPYGPQQRVYGHHYYPQPEPKVHPIKVKPSLVTKVDDVLSQKQELIEQLLTLLHLPSPAGQPQTTLIAKLMALKEELKNKKPEVKAVHKPAYGQAYGGASHYQAKTTPAKKPAIIKAVPDKDGKIPSLVSPSSLPAEVIPAAATILKTEPFAILIQDGGDLTSTSRGFAITYSHQVCA